MLPSTLFYIAAVVMLASALAVVLSRKAVYSAILLVLTFFSLAVMYLLLEAYFLALDAGVAFHVADRVNVYQKSHSRDHQHHHQRESI